MQNTHRHSIVVNAPVKDLGKLRVGMQECLLVGGAGMSQGLDNIQDGNSLGTYHPRGGCRELDGIDC